jgi:hypothetical protein
MSTLFEQTSKMRRGQFYAEQAVVRMFDKPVKIDNLDCKRERIQDDGKDLLVDTLHGRLRESYGEWDKIFSHDRAEFFVSIVVDLKLNKEEIKQNAGTAILYISINVFDLNTSLVTKKCFHPGKDGFPINEPPLLLIEE